MTNSNISDSLETRRNILTTIDGTVEGLSPNLFYLASKGFQIKIHSPDEGERDWYLELNRSDVVDGYNRVNNLLKMCLDCTYPYMDDVKVLLLANKGMLERHRGFYHVVEAFFAEEGKEDLLKEAGKWLTQSNSSMMEASLLHPQAAEQLFDARYDRESGMRDPELETSLAISNIGIVNVHAITNRRNNEGILALLQDPLAAAGPACDYVANLLTNFGTSIYNQLKQDFGQITAVANAVQQNQTTSYELEPLVDTFFHELENVLIQIGDIYGAVDTYLPLETSLLGPENNEPEYDELPDSLQLKLLRHRESYKAASRVDDQLQELGRNAYQMLSSSGIMFSGRGRERMEAFHSAYMDEETPAPMNFVNEKGSTPPDYTGSLMFPFQVRYDP